MKWVLVWWMITPGHSQIVHIHGGFPNEKSCVVEAAEIEIASNKPVHWHCSVE